MTRFLTAVSLLGLLAACDGQQPLNFGDTNDDAGDVLTNDDGEVVTDPITGDPIEVAENGIPEPISADLEAVAYNQSTGQLEVTIIALDSTPVSATYERNTNIDVPGYVAFSQQEDPLDRLFFAYVGTSNDGATQGALVMDGGQFFEFVAGVNYSQEGIYSPHTPTQPNDGLVTYTGNYIGMLNIPTTDDTELLTPTTAVDPDNLPFQATRILGQAVVNADFADMFVNAGVADRVVIDTPIATDVPAVLLPIGLFQTEISEDGSFYGNIQIGSDVMGEYGGTFGGQNASGVAIGVHLDGDFIPEVDGEEEYGVIVLTKCGLPGDGALCPDAQPDF